MVQIECINVDLLRSIVHHKDKNVLTASTSTQSREVGVESNFLFERFCLQWLV